jgi:hypothetical protein
MAKSVEDNGCTNKHNCKYKKFSALSLRKISRQKSKLIWKTMKRYFDNGLLPVEQRAMFMFLAPQLTKIEGILTTQHFGCHDRCGRRYFLLSGC